MITSLISTLAALLLPLPSKVEWGEMTVCPDSSAFVITDSIPGITSPEGYTLRIDSHCITARALSEAGLFYAKQTLAQLRDGDSIRQADISDQPRFPYRGMMIDISRHFRDKEFIMKQIDAAARLKLNRLHLHLTDAAGWRIEIRRYPQLTDNAAWRIGPTWKEWVEGGMKYTSASTPGAYGGYLTQDDARQLVEYAAERFIEIIPEIEIPSHSEEVTAALPMLSCTHRPQGEPDLCIGNEETFRFIENVLDEIMEIFPGQYIHIGGDEASKRAWTECPLCKKRMEEEGLDNADRLQSYMIGRVERYVNSKGRKIIGWDEILEGGLAPNATVMSWRGTQGGIKAAMSGHDAIMTPGDYCYLDSYQDAPHTHPEAFGGYTPLERVYSYNPVPDSLPQCVKEHIIGVQGNLWCEYITTAAHAEYMLYPRMFAIAEAAWTPQALRQWADFKKRATSLSVQMTKEGYNCFDLRSEYGNRPEALTEATHLAVGKPVTYNVPWWDRYDAAADATLTDGKRGGWNYSDGRWQGFLYRGNQRLDATVDLGQPTDITYVGAEFMQITQPGVWFPQRVLISVSQDGENYTLLTELNHEQQPNEGVAFKTFEWSGEAKARYVRYQAEADNGCQFTDEIIIR